MTRSRTSTCKNCGEEIWASNQDQIEWWGGKEWIHLGTGVPRCEIEVWAEPVSDGST